ncbi:TetR/AcrR family transcriptional regulator [Aphanothece sacrum]|uniref:TetR family transcriptional regulator n=1 Tax=Aphanothece sacrum FPU1 TaxID=1920663 RepID=A0A401IGI6_APHSA|nr:TetR/AcrR family transcriptional regulator [Aphanothece sacrum]GBF80393.1 TetR family transcriptional regulator [Aphanothece sacrum FPU1]GBF84900.1 transcriptional regulator, TetR family [Aphanothece sacrum FPU3]
MKEPVLYSLPTSEKARQILGGALPEFLKNGYAATTMDKIASSAGVSKQTLYSHFSDKEQLFTTLVQRMACEKFRLVWSQPLAGEPQIVLTQLAERILKQVNDTEHLCFVRLIIAESDNHPELSQLFLRNFAQPANNILTNYLKEHSELNISDPEVIARIFVGTLIHHLLTQEMLHGQEIMPMSADRLISNLVSLIVTNK